MRITKEDQLRRPCRTVNGIERKLDKVTNTHREICRTSAAKTRRRREIFDRAEGCCEQCGREVFFDLPPLHPKSMHWHHEVHKGMGGAWTDDSMENGKCLCRDCHLRDEHHQF